MGKQETYLRNIRQRVRKKRQDGARLSAVEAYYKRFENKGNRAFAPSKALTALSVLATLSSPAAILFVLALIISAEVPSAAWFSEPTPKALPSQQVAALVEARDQAQERLALETPEAARIIPMAYSPQPQTINSGLVEFISGIISVYCPSEKDPGSIARLIVKLSREEGVDPIYIASVIAVESSFRSRARSKVGATGLMQIMPRTARILSPEVFGTKKPPSLKDPMSNIRMGIHYLKQLERNYKGNRFKALAAYNWGPGNLGKAKKRGRAIPKQVQRYATQVLERTLRWQKHYEKATQGARALEIVAEAS